MKNSFYIDLQRFMLIPTKFPLTRYHLAYSRLQYLSNWNSIMEKT